MIFGCAHLVSCVSRFMTLQPGDLIITGTPPGVGKEEETQAGLSGARRRDDAEYREGGQAAATSGRLASRGARLSNDLSEPLPGSHGYRHRRSFRASASRLLHACLLRARLSLWDLTEDALVQAKAETGASDARALDIADTDQVGRTMEPTMATLGGKLDVLIASAGITRPNATVREYPVDAWRRVTDANWN